MLQIGCKPLLFIMLRAVGGRPNPEICSCRVGCDAHAKCLKYNFLKIEETLTKRRGPQRFWVQWGGVRSDKTFENHCSISKFKSICLQHNV